MFVEKLNKKQEGVYVIEEEKTIVDGIWEGYLNHDNVNRESIYIYTGSKLTGEKVENYFISTPSEMPWKTHLKVFSESEKIYITYETTGDQVEAEDINLVQGVLVDEIERATSEEKRIELKLDNEIVRAMAEDERLSEDVEELKEKKVDKVAGKGLSTNDYTDEEKQKLAGIEDGANKYVHPNTHPASMITESSARRFVSDDEKNTWNTVVDKADRSYVDAELNKKAEKTDIPTKVSQLENDEGYVTQEELEGVGHGDMTKSVYDTNDDGKVDVAELADNVPWTGITNKPSTFPPSSHNHSISDITGLQEALDAKMEKGSLTWNDLKGV